jgi:C4-dicarboxylate-specific signal transduction histidine kinase
MLDGPFAQLCYNAEQQQVYLNSKAQALLQLPAQLDFIALQELLEENPCQKLIAMAQEEGSLLLPWQGRASQYLLWQASQHDNQIYFQVSDQSKWGSQLEQWQHQARLAVVGQVMHGICHEVNQPLNAMRLRLYGLQQLANNTHPIEDLPQQLQELDNQVGRCANTLVNMRTLGSHKSISDSKFDIGHSLQQINSLLKYQLQMNNVRLQLHEPVPTCPIYGQAQRFEQILINLINNARDALALNNQSGNIQLRLQRLDDHYLLTVQDDGPGIPKELHKKIFEPYYTSKKKHQGTGLGLALCRDLIDELGGKISLQSRPGNTCFSLQIPSDRIS